MKIVFSAIFASVLFLPGVFAQITLNPSPSRVVGQDSTQIKSLNPNLVEGREVYLPEGIALDTSTNPPALYVSDTRNNRVLGFRNASAFANGQTADLVLGQPDLATTLAAAAMGLTEPSGVAVDSHGNVYVVDSGNNRILRFPRPFAQSGAPAPDIVIGQPSFATNAGNQGGISAATLSFTSGTSSLQALITLDLSGNLWVADAGNNRVLRFNAAVLGSPAASGPAADIVIGQSNFTSNSYNPGPNPLTSLTAFTTPTGIAFDTAGRLFVSESISSQRSRILMWTPPFFTGQAASRILGVDTSNPPPPAISEYQLGPSSGALFPVGDGIGIADTYYSRVLVFPPVDQWTPNTTYQAAIEVAGQPDFASGTVNQGLPSATANTLNHAAAAVFFNSELYVADSGNNRILVMPQSAMPQGSNAFGPATRVLGQDAMNLNAPNLVEGREFNFQNPNTGAPDAGIAVDLTSSTPHLYVADPYNNRILGYNDLRNIQPGAKADLVIGQPDFQQTLINYPGNNANGPNASGLYFPIGLAVDTNGNLYVADTGNGRVLRFPRPFANYAAGSMEQADLVIGQSGFTAAKITDATQRTMAEPYGLAFTLAGGLLVSDVFLNRVLYFQGQPADLTSGMSASGVFGQPDFTSSGSGSGPTQFNAPHHIATDSDDRLYVADAGNSRIAIFNHSPTAPPGSAAALFLTDKLGSPRGIYVNPVNGEIWVADEATGNAVRYPNFQQLIAAGTASNATVSDPARPVAVVEDGWGNLFLADGASRVATWYPSLASINAANFLSQNVLAPGMIAAMYSLGNYNQFGGQGISASTLPLPKTLNGVQVLFNGAPVPLFYAGPNQINFQVPMAASQSGTVEVQVLEAATGRLLGDGSVEMQLSVPGLFTQTGDGIGTASALNQDNTVNSQNNPAKQGTVIQLYGTGQGFVSGAPPDGTAPTGPVPDPTTPMVIMGTGFVPSANIQYSGLAPGLVGVWQINVLIPNTVITLPNNPTQVVVIQNNVPSGGAGLGRFVQIYVTQ